MARVKKQVGAIRSNPPLVQVKITRQFRDSQTGRFTAAPKYKNPKRAERYIGAAHYAGIIIIRRVIEYDDREKEVIGVKVIFQDLRVLNRRGYLTKRHLIEKERDLSREAFASYNPSRVKEIEYEMLHEAHRSDKSKRAAISKKKNKIAKEKRDERKKR